MRLIAYVFIALAFYACKGNENKQESSGMDTVKTNSVKTEYTCPMHPEVISDTAGTCPQCGMDLEVKS